VHEPADDFGIMPVREDAEEGESGGEGGWGEEHEYEESSLREEVVGANRSNAVILPAGSPRPLGVGISGGRA